MNEIDQRKLLSWEYINPGPFSGPALAVPYVWMVQTRSNCGSRPLILGYRNIFLQKNHGLKAMR